MSRRTARRQERLIDVIDDARPLTTLWFSPTDWYRPQAVNFRVFQDLDAVNEEITLFYASSSTAYNAHAISLPLSVTDDDTPTLCLLPAAQEVAERAGQATFTVRLNVTGSDVVTVNYAAADATATAPGDYTTASGALPFPALTASPRGALTRTITVPLTDDTLAEGEETFNLTLSNPANASLDGGGTELAARATLADNDAITVVPGVPTTARPSVSTTLPVYIQSGCLFVFLDFSTWFLSSRRLSKRRAEAHSLRSVPRQHQLFQAPAAFQYHMV